MVLHFYTAATPAMVDRTFGRALKAFRPHIPAHQFHLFKEDEPPPAPGAGEVCLVAGSKPLGTLQAAKIAQKGRTVTSLRERPLKSPAGGWYLVTFDPAVTQTEFDKREIIDWDVRLAHRLMTTGGLKPEVGQYDWVATLQPMIDQVDAKYAKTGRPVDVCIDTETMGFYPWYSDKDIVSISFTIEAGRSSMLYLGPQPAPLLLNPQTPLLEQVRFFLTSPKVKLRLANGKYDLIWIAEKWGIECTNFRFDTLLVGNLLDENRTNGLNLHAKLFTPIGGYDDCVAPDTRLLTADLRWVVAGSVAPGDQLVGFDEHNGGVKGLRRKLRVAVAESTKRLMKPGVRLGLSNGSVLTCSFDHGFLSQTGVNGGGTVWRRACQLRVGSKLKMGAPVVEQGSTYDTGWMGGFLDGEGYCAKSHAAKTGAFVLGWSQKPGAVHDRAVAAMQSIATSGYVQTKPAEGVLTTKYTQWPALCALMRFRPERLIAKRAWVGASIPQEPEAVTVMSIENVGLIEVVSLQTSTHTFIAEGVCSHNSFNQSQDKGAMEKIAPADLRVYQGGDTDACFQVADLFRDQLAEDKALTRFYLTILHPAARAFEKIERRGVLVDQEKYHILRDDLRKVIKQSQNEAMALLPYKMRIKYRERIDAQLAEGKSPLLPSILKEYFFTPHGLNLTPKQVTEKTGEPSMQKAHLRQFADVPAAKEMVDVLTTMDSAAKTLSTFVEGFLKHLRPDGCFHPSYMLFHGDFDNEAGDESGTVTGRLSCKDPAYQTLPKKTKWAKRLRECFVAPKGKVLISADYSQGELRVVACVAPEKTMIASYLQGFDLHAVTGAKLANVALTEFIKWKDSEDKELAELYEEKRSKAKPMNFGLLYGMSAEGFRTYAWASYGVRLTSAEAEQMRNAFFELYPGLVAYHDNMKEIVRIHEQVRSPLGRIRHLPMIRSWDRMVKSKAERQAINSPIQSCLSDMMLWGIAQIDRELPEVEMVGMVHDALVAYVPEDRVQESAGRIVQLMSNLPLHEVGWSPPLQFTADVEAGPDLASMKKVKLVA